ncbi:MAG: DUF1826 domain-containing protein [Chromatiales bacterium]|jgi:hypothetical protein
MSITNIAPESPPAAPTWQRVPELADLVEIFNPGVQVCSWQRELDPDIEAYLSGLQQTRELQVIETLSPIAQPRLDSLPEGPGRPSLINDLAFLREIVCELLGCSEVGLRLARMGRAMCPGWHIDRVGIRFVCTYHGPGTQWLDDQDIDRCELQHGHIKEEAAVQASAGEIVLLKGALWQNNEALGAVHRSPELAPDAAMRTLVTLDPLWRS